jgi:predicted O-linked N-acetylglucosamine transferase (SPINDLY family)
MRTAIEAGLHEGRRVIEPFGNLMISQSPADQLQCARIYAARYPKPPALWAGERYEHSRLRVAYVSGDFRAHPVAVLMAGVLEHHDRSAFDITALSFGPDDKSPIRTRIENGCERFLDMRGARDDDIAATLRRMEIDIAVDLMGYTADCRPAIFASRPAPVQVNYLGFPATMAADFMDYILADNITIRPQDERFYSEHIVRLPDTYLPTDSARPRNGDAGGRARHGLPEDGFVFCSFNKSYKINPAMFTIWMRLLSAVPGSVLWLPEADTQVHENLARAAQAHGVAASRLVFAPFLDNPADHLARLALADLFLDTLPFNAHTTAADALWAGLPVLTCAGRTFAGRVAASCLHALGLPTLIAPSLDAYEAEALRLARNPGDLAALRGDLARRIATGALFDTARFTLHLESAYRGMQARTARGLPPAGFAVERIA